MEGRKLKKKDEERKRQLQQLVKLMQRVIKPHESYYNEMKLTEELKRDKNQEEYQDGKEVEKALLAFWEYKEQTKEFDCVQSIEIPQPIPFKDMNYYEGKRC